MRLNFEQLAILNELACADNLSEIITSQGERTQVRFASLLLERIDETSLSNSFVSPSGSDISFLVPLQERTICLY